MVAGTESQSSEWKFIETEPLGLKGEAGEQRVWDRLRQTFRQGGELFFGAITHLKKTNNSKRTGYLDCLPRTRINYY